MRPPGVVAARTLLKNLPMIKPFEKWTHDLQKEKQK